VELYLDEQVSGSHFLLPPSVHIPHRFSHFKPCSSKTSDTFSITSTAFVVVSNDERDKNSPLIAPSLI